MHSLGSSEGGTEGIGLDCTFLCTFGPFQSARRASLFTATQPSSVKNLHFIYSFHALVNSYPGFSSNIRSDAKFEIHFTYQMNDLSTTGQANALGASATDNSQPREHLPDSDGSLADQDPKQEKGIDSEQVTKKKSLFARPWSRKQLGIFSVLLFLGLGLVAIIIALPIIYTRRNHPDDGDSYQLYHSNHDDPSYKVRANHPVYAVHNFPDPGLLQHNGTWYAFGTNPKKHDPNTIHIPVATSSNFVNWTLHDDYDAMPTLGGWERSVNHWAPDAIQRVSRSPQTYILTSTYLTEFI